MMRTDTIDQEMKARAIETIERNARAQAAIIEDILDVSRIITGKLRLTTRAVELLPIIEAAIDSVRPAADAKAIRLTKELGGENIVLTGDPDRLQQIIWNLLANAVKFTPPGGDIRVRLDRVAVVNNSARESNHLSQARITVSDTGQGISRDFLPFVFERFRQADSTSTRVHGGLGLGLAIVRHLAEMHGGTVEVASEGEGRGATFTVMLPISRCKTGRDNH
jgi:signal transduction histidine kinase